jgi:muramoyltetrapeptide carboxypeptidase
MPNKVKPPIIHIAATANPAGTVMDALGVRSAREVLDRIQETVGEGYRVRGTLPLLEAEVDDHRAGRRDDRARLRELHTVFSDDEVAAVIGVRGGGWLVRLLPDLDIAVLDRRRRPVAMIGFSELTPLINWVGRHRFGRGYYYMTPAFANTGLHEYAVKNAKRLAGRKLSPSKTERFANDYADEHFPSAWRQYWRDVKAMLDGRAPRRTLVAKHVSGRLPRSKRAVFVGGCLSLVTAMAVEGNRPRIDPAGKWLIVEDLAETPQRIDRQLAHLKIAGWFDRCAGVLVGDFHMDGEDQVKHVLEILGFHLPPQRHVPVLVSREVGHGWPQAVLPLGKALALQVSQSRSGGSRVQITPHWPQMKVLGVGIRKATL